MKKLTAEQIKFNELVYKLSEPFGVSLKVDHCLTYSIQIEPTRYKGKKFDGMQIILDLNSGVYEVSEFQAGKNADKLYIYRETKNIKNAIKVLMMGNKRKPIKIID